MTDRQTLLKGETGSLPVHLQLPTFFTKTFLLFQVLHVIKSYTQNINIKREHWDILYTAPVSALSFITEINVLCFFLSP